MKAYYSENIQDTVFDAGTPAWLVTMVLPHSDYSLQLEFQDGKKGIYDARPLLKKKIYEPLNDLKLFMRAHVEGDTVVWNDDVDIAPEHLYENCIARQ